MMFSFNEFILGFSVKSKATSKIKNQQILSSLYLNDVGIYLRDESFETDIGIVKLHPPRETHRVV